MSLVATIIANRFCRRGCCYKYAIKLHNCKKTTLSRASFPEKPYVSLENPEQREFAEEDPKGFLKHYPDGAILDEVQRCYGIVNLSREFGVSLRY